MSWRLLWVTLLLALAASAWGGMRLGDWLVEHAPPSVPAPSADADSSQPVLDANGKPYLAQPPQPRIDGTLGVPDKPEQTQWAVTTASLFDTVKDPSVVLSRDTLSASDARELAQSAQNALPQGSSDIATLDLMPPLPGPPVDAAPIRAANSFDRGALVQHAPNSASGGGNTADWQGTLRREMARCATQGFFERPTCAWNARNRYCGPNKAWGTTPECPRKPGE